jgi:D-glycero-alpha-D-manno-heptose-7-phosphate kinase
MIITRTPFRISFAGGDSDLATFHNQEPGFVLSTAIDKYMFVAVKRHFGRSFRVSDSLTEIVDSVDQIQHPHRQARLREELRELEEAPFRFAAEGSKIVYVGDY